MARGGNGKGAYGYPNVYNETDSGEEADGKLYFSYDEVMSGHLSATGDMTETPNTKSGGGIMGGPAPGEPNPANMGKD